MALITLSELGGPHALEITLNTIELDSPEMRFQAIAALAVLAPEQAHASILPTLRDEDALVRAHAAEVLGSLGDHPKARDALSLCLEDHDREVRNEASIALAAMGACFGASS